MPVTPSDLDSIRATNDRAELQTLVEQITEELRPLADQDEELQRKIRPLREALYTANVRLQELS